MVAGISGTLAGSELSKQLGRFTRKAEAIVCAAGMLLATPFLFLAIVVAQYRQLYVAWVSKDHVDNACVCVCVCVYTCDVWYVFICLPISCD